MTDASEELPEHFQSQVFGRPCGLCLEPMLQDEDLMITTYLRSHVECIVRSGVGSVAHLERRCSCRSGSFTRPEVTEVEEEELTYREDAKQTLAWLINNNQGRFHD